MKAAAAPALREERTQIARVKPANLTYSVDEAPPLPLTIVMGLQHVFVMSVGWIFVVVVATSIGASSLETATMIRISMIASGLATILQARTRGPVGSGYLCPFSCGPAYISASILAGKTGGLSLVFGMTSFSGAFEAVLSRFMKRLQKLFPPEVTGLVVAMVGLDLVSIGCPRFMGYTPNSQHLDVRAILIALFTLAAMVVPTLLTKSKLRLYPVLLGLFLGYLTAILTRTLTSTQMRQVLDVPLIGFPRLPAGHHFSFAMTLPFMIASVCSIFKTVGDLTFCEKINDAQWKRTDMRDISGGILAGGICSVLSGLLGGLGQSTFSSNVGLSLATGATSRIIAWPAGLICIALRLFPPAGGGLLDHAGARDGRGRRLRRLLHDPRRHSGDALAHARCAAHLRNRSGIDLRDERADGARTLCCRAGMDKPALQLFAGAGHGAGGGVEPIASIGNFEA